MTLTSCHFFFFSMYKHSSLSLVNKRITQEKPTNLCLGNHINKEAQKRQKNQLICQLNGACEQLMLEDHVALLHSCH